MFKKSLKSFSSRSSLLAPRRGFTLIEILIVVAIIGILASVVIVGLGPVQRKGRDARRVSDLKEVQTGLELYYGKFASYPTGISDWAALKTKLTDSTNTNIGVSNVPVDPRTPDATYSYASDGSTYVLKAVLEDAGNAALKGSYKGTPPSGSMSFDCTAALDYCVSL